MIHEMIYLGWIYLMKHLNEMRIIELRSRSCRPDPRYGAGALEGYDA
jgi:hypothetical protein